VTLGQKATVTGSGTVDEKVDSGSFAIDLSAGPIKEHWTGDLCAPKTFKLPLFAGSVTWDGLKCPLAQGDTEVSTDIQLSSLLPSSLTKSSIKITATDSSNAKLLCLDLETAPSAAEDDVPDPAEANGKSLGLTWSDCGDAETHGKVTGLSTDHVTLGQKATVTGSGTVDEKVDSGSFAIDLSAGPIKEHWTGDLCAPKTFKLPLFAGSVTWDGLKCPLAQGDTEVSTDIQLSSLLPSSLTKSSIKITATDSSNAKLLCLDLETAPSAVVV